MRYLLYLLWALISLLVIVLVVITVSLTVFNDGIEASLVEKIELKLNRDIDIQGGFSFRINPRPTFYARDIKLANAEWAKEPWMLEIGSLSASLSLRNLLDGEVVLKSVEAKNVEILVEKDPILKEVNWQIGSGGEPKPLKWVAEHLRIQNALIEDARININVGPVEHLIDVSVITGQTNYFSKAIQIKALAQLHDKAIELDLELNNLSKMFLREPTSLSFKGTHGITQIKGQGEVRDLLRWRGHDIQLDLSTSSLVDLQSWMTTKLIETPPLEASAKFVQPETWRSARFDDIELVSEGLDGQTSVSGQVAQISSWNGIDLTGISHYPLASIMRWKGLDSETDVLIDAEFVLMGDKQDALGFEIVSADITGEGIVAEGKGRITHLLQPNTEGIAFKVHADSLDKIGLISAQQWLKTDALDGTLQLKRKAGKLALEQIDISAFDGRLQATGSLDDITKTQLGKFGLKTKLKPEDLDLINSLNQKNYPIFEQTNISAQINTERTTASSPEASISLVSDGLEITATGAITDLKTIATNNAKVSISANSIGKINQQFAVNLPELGKLEATGSANGNLTNLFNINVEQATLNSKYQQISASGSIKSLGPDLKAELAIKANVDSIENVPKLLESDAKMPPQLKGVGVARLTAESLNDWSAEDIKLVFQGSNRGVITGSVMHFPKAPEFTLIADLQRIQLDSLPNNALINTLAPENIQAYFEINKSAEDKNFSLNNIDGQLSLATGSALVNVAGDIENVNHFDGLSLSLGISASELLNLPYLSELSLKTGLDGVASVKLSGNAADLDIQIASFNIGETDLQGKLNIKTANGGKPRITGDLVSDNLDVLALLHQEKRTRMFSDEPLSLDWLNNIDAELSFKAGRFNGVIAELDDATINVFLEDGILNIPNTNGTVGNGRVQMWLTIVAQRQPYNIISSIRGDAIKPERLNLFGESDFIRGGVVDIDIGFGGAGTSIANYMDNVYGKIQLQLHKSLLKNKNLELFGADLVTGILDIINPFSRQEDYLPIECGVIHFPVVKGDAIASQGIAIKTDKVTVLGGGAIDLGTEEMEILIKPKARKGLGLSAGILANIAKISGDFANPKISIDSSSLIQTTASIGAAIFSGGWTLLAQGLLDRNKANSNVCEQTLLEPNKTFVEEAKNKIRKFGTDR